MTQPKPEAKPNLAAIGVAFIGAGTALMAVGLAVMDSVPMAAGGAGIMGVGVVYLLRGAWRLG
ncbi:MAG TPA: hypothetical protein PLF78_10810 [Caulobacter sp.]|nr:hypothetical protein [Caulobacter sp.]